MTVVNPKSISGINSITTGSGSDDILTIHTNNGTERLRIDSTGTTKIVTGIVTTLTATTGIVTTLTANTVTSLGAVSGTTGTFSGAVSGTTGTFTSHVSLGDNDQLRIGDSNDLQIYHDTSNTVLVNNTGDLYIQNDSSNDTNKILIRPKAGEASIECVPNAEVSLFHNGSKRITTTVQGASITRQNAGEYFNVNANYGSSGDQAIECSGDLTFYTNASNIAARLDQDGLKFNADTAAANALDDYEEGTWTPSNPNAGYTFANTAGYYTKVGRMVHWFLHATISLVPNDNNVYEIHGLPYTSSNASHNYGWHTQVNYAFDSNNAIVANMRALVEKNNTYVYFHTVGLGSAARVTNSQFRTGMQGKTTIICGTYMAA